MAEICQAQEGGKGATLNQVGAINVVVGIPERRVKRYIG